MDNVLYAFIIRSIPGLQRNDVIKLVEVIEKLSGWEKRQLIKVLADVLIFED